MQTNKRIGQHKGLWFYTIGQRHGLGFGGGPWFVVKKDVNNNILYVSKGYEPSSAFKSEFGVSDFHFLTEEVDLSNVTFKIRHTPEFHKARVEKINDNEYRLYSECPIHGVAPGQFCVVYDEEASSMHRFWRDKYLSRPYYIIGRNVNEHFFLFYC